MKCIGNKHGNKPQGEIPLGFLFEVQKSKKGNLPFADRRSEKSEQLKYPLNRVLKRCFSSNPRIGGLENELGA
jgi:hypothetical protein